MKSPQDSSDSPLEDFPLEIDIVYSDKAWPKSLEDTSIECLITQAIKTACNQVISTFEAPSEICIVLSNDHEQRQLNKKWRHKDSSTNVLSFPQIEAFSEPVGMLGDIILARQTIISEAKQQNKLLSDHLCHLVVHGFLHILGYDHENDIQAEQMECLEIDILRQMGIKDPYAD